eukprot:3270500-Pyramimonas_sp.AAC.1
MMTDSGQRCTQQAPSARRRNDLLRHWGVARFKGHCDSTHRKTGDQIHRPRCKSRAANSWWSLGVLIIACRSTAHVLRYRASLVHGAIQPPAQKAARQRARGEHDRLRDFPRLRDSPSFSRALSLN